MKRRLNAPPNVTSNRHANWRCSDSDLLCANFPQNVTVKRHQWMRRWWWSRFGEAGLQEHKEWNDKKFSGKAAFEMRENIYIYTMGRSNLRAIPVQTFKKEQQASSVCRCVCMAAEARAMVGVNKAVRKAGLWDAFRTSLPAKNGSRKLGNIRLCGGRERLSSIPTSWIPFTYQQQRIRQKKEKNSKLCQGFPKYRCLSLDAEEEAKRYMYSKCVRGKHLAMTQLEHILSFSLVLLWFKFLFVTSVP